MNPPSGLSEKVEAALDTLRPGFDADGAGLEVTAWPAEDAVQVTLTLGPDACLDCIVSPPLLSDMITATIQQEVPEIAKVEVADPRA